MARPHAEDRIMLCPRCPLRADPHEHASACPCDLSNQAASGGHSFMRATLTSLCGWKIDGVNVLALTITGTLASST